jgi:hypothetical protein
MEVGSLYCSRQTRTPTYNPFKLTPERASLTPLFWPLAGIVKAIAAAAGKEAKIVHYDPSKMGLKKGEGFPFRAGHFFASADKAKRVLGWKPAHNFVKDVDQVGA